MYRLATWLGWLLNKLFGPPKDPPPNTYIGDLSNAELDDRMREEDG